MSAASRPVDSVLPQMRQRVRAVLRSYAKRRRECTFSIEENVFHYARVLGALGLCDDFLPSAELERYRRRCDQIRCARVARLPSAHG